MPIQTTLRYNLPTVRMVMIEINKNKQEITNAVEVVKTSELQITVNSFARLPLRCVCQIICLLIIYLLLRQHLIFNLLRILDTLPLSDRCIANIIQVCGFLMIFF